MALKTADIRQVVEEIAPVLRNGWIQKIQQPADRTLVLEIRVPGETNRLLISCEPETARLHLQFRPMPNPPSPPPFCQFLRAHLQGARVEGMRQLSQDRIVALDFVTKEGPRRLVCELTGKTSNILLLDQQEHVLADLQRHRDLIGQPYHLPLKHTSPSGQEKPSQFTAAPAHSLYPLSAAIEGHYHDKETHLSLERARLERFRALRTLHKKTERRIEAWREDLAKAAKYRDYARYGELIKANLGSIKTGMHRVTLVDYYDQALPEITLLLDSAKSAHGNMDDYFKKHRKHLAAERELKPRIAQAERELEKLQQEMSSIQQGAWIAPPPSITTLGGTRRGSRTPIASSDKRRGPFRRFTSTDGLPILVGRNAKENDELTFGLAKSDDLWLHARGTAGSHVLVRLQKGTDPPPETLRDAATLALLYSDLKKTGKGDVIYTRRKWVKKAKGQAAGAVIVTQEKTIYVKLDTQRLGALKERSN